MGHGPNRGGTGQIGGGTGHIGGGARANYGFSEIFLFTIDDRLGLCERQELLLLRETAS